jgi:Cytochrome c554 and c-prime
MCRSRMQPLFVLVLIFFVIAAPDSSFSQERKPPPRRDYVGDSVCRICHQEKARTYIQTAHHRATGWPSERTIKGSFTPDSNVLKTSNPYVSFEMTMRKGGYFQSAVEQLSPSKTISRTERIDIVAGPARKGQSYLFWKGDQLFQLPVTYWTGTSSWVNSPSYPDGSPHFDKAIIPRCLECHASYFEWLPPPVNRYRKTSLVLGIFCEKCHGPGREHVARHRLKSTLPPGTSEAIVNPASLTRNRQIDVCGLCHSGNGTPIQPALSFIPGAALEDYIDIPYTSLEEAVDVHGSQVQLLKRSKCFQSTTTLTCTTCHDVHKSQIDAAAFSPRCLTCHEPRECGEYSKAGEQIVGKCVDCHMPLQESRVLFSNTNGKKLMPKVRNHQIAIYPGESIH